MPNYEQFCTDHVVKDVELWSPVEVTDPDVRFEHCRFRSKDPQHTLLTTGPNTQVYDCDFLGDYNYGARRAIAVNSGGVRIEKSRFRDIHHAQDSQCVAGWDGTRDLIVEDCYGEASGENVIMGGADAQSEDRVPQDIVIRRCYWTKSQYWRYKPNGCTVKNLFELKNAKRVLIEDCDFSFSWTDGQTGFGIVLTVRNQDGGNPYATVEDVTFRRCVSRDTIQGIQILGTDYTHPSGIMKRVAFESCRFTYNGGGNGIQLGDGVEGLSFTGCSFWSSDSSKWLALFGTPCKGLVVKDSNANEGWYGIHGDNSSPGIPSLTQYAPDAQFANVALWRGPSGANYPYPAGITVMKKKEKKPWRVSCWCWSGACCGGVGGGGPSSWSPRIASCRHRG